MTPLKKRSAILKEGGAAGHLQHVYDNLNLTFGEIKDIINSAGRGKLEKVTEKLDGMALVFTYNVSENQLKAARNGGDIKSGGMDATALAKKFFGRGNIEVAFTSAFDILDKAIASLPATVKKKVFGPSGNKWYSIEVIYMANPGTINYDSNSVVFHASPVFKIQKDGSIAKTIDTSGVDVLSSRIEQMQSSISNRGWKLYGPTLLNLKNISNGSVIKSSLSQINSVMSSAGCTDKDTLYDYLRSLMSEYTSELNLSSKAESIVLERAIDSDSAQSINDIKKIVPKENHVEVLSFIKSAEKIKKDLMKPIEVAIQSFAVEVLKGLKSSLIDDSEQEVRRLRAAVTSAIKAIESSGNEIAMQVLQKEMQKLKSAENIESAMEGIVFFYKGQAFKFTGNFAPAHQILGLFKYGRAGVPKMDVKESIKRISQKWYI